MTSATLLALARRQIEAHPATQAVSEVEVEDGRTSISFDLDLDFGARWKAEGKSPSGVLPVERVRLDFPDGYPVRAPEPSYRPDLGRGMAHVQPWLTPDKRPVPCLTGMPAVEFVAAEGLTAYVDQFRVWLLNAAEDRLSEADEWWEPSRRDEIAGSVVVNRAALRALADDPKLRGGAVWLQTAFVAHVGDNDLGAWFGEIGKPAKVESGYGIRDAGDGFVIGKGLALALWATSFFGAAPTFGQYEPDDVTDFDGLIAKADRLDVGHKLRHDVKVFRKMGWNHPRITLPLIVVFLVRRPRPLQGEDSSIEILPYLLPVSVPGGTPVQNAGAVKPLSARDRIEGGLLRRLSGTEPLAGRWVALGAGSLGSKLSLHLARAGSPPVAVIDRALLQPHNVARHGLYPASGNDFGWYGPKADVLAGVLSRITRETVAPISLDALEAQAELKRLANVVQTPMTLVNTTASLVVREGLSAPGSSNVRMFDAELYDQGQMGVLRLEGPDRNPNASELAGAFWALGTETPQVGDHLFRARADLTRIAVGEGCGSATMVAEDAVISLHAAAIASAVDQALIHPPPAGEIQVWRREGGSLCHEVYAVDPFARIPLEDGWTLSISASAHAAIAADIARFPKVETGGVIIGRVSPIAQSIQVQSVLPAPADSIRRAEYFELGVLGLEDAFSQIHKASAGALYCVGTWHSHLGDATPSAKDRQTAARLAGYTPHPLALLIRGVEGYRGVFAGPE